MNFKQQSFITEYLRHRSAFTAYCMAYNVQDASNYDSIMSSANRLLNQPEISSVIDSVLDGIRHEVEQQLRAEMKTDMLTIQRKRELLAKIATGETYAVQNYKGKDCNMCTQHVWPTINQMLKAIDLDNKMVGLYTTPHSTHKAQSAATLNAQVAEQVDKFLQSMGLTIDKQDNSSLDLNSSFEGGAAGGGCSLASEKSTEMATNHNKFSNEPENSSLEGGAAGGGCSLAPEKDDESEHLSRPESIRERESTTFISPIGLINIRTNRDHDGEGGKA